MSKRPIEIRNMFVSMVPGYGEDVGWIYDVAILTPSDGYVEYELRFCYNRMTHVAFQTIKSLLSDYRFTAESEVCTTDNVPEKNPLAMYLSILSQQMGFKVLSASPKKISDRLCGVIRGVKKAVAGDKSQDRMHFGVIWKYLVESGSCKWITPAYDQYLKGLNGQRRRRKKLVRIGAYYMRLRRLKYQYTRRSRQRAAARAVFP